MNETIIRIKQRREELNMTQEELALKLGFKSRSSINKIELGLNDLTQSKILDFAKALNVTPSYLMGWEGINEMDIGRKIRDILENKNMSYSELSRITEIPYSALQRYLTGETPKIPVERIESIAKALNVIPTYLMGWKEENIRGPKEKLSMNETRIRIEEIMNDKGMSMGNLSELTNIPKTTISRYINEPGTIPADRVETIATALGVSPSYLMGWEDLSNITTPDSVLKLHEINSNSTSTTIFVTVNDIDQAIELVNAFNNQTSELVVEVRVSKNGIQNEGREE